MTTTLPLEVTLLLADDHAVTLWGLQQLVESAQPAMSCSGTARTCAELMAHPALQHSDVVLLDLRLGDVNAIHSVAQLVTEIGEHGRTRHRRQPIPIRRSVLEVTSGLTMGR